MEMIMNTKRALLFTALLCASPVLNVVASAESMYKDLMECIVLSNDFHGKQHKVESLRCDLVAQKKALQDKVLYYHTTKFSKIELEKALIWGGVGLFASIAGCDILYDMYVLSSNEKLSLYKASRGRACALGEFCIAAGCFGTVLYKLYQNSIQIRSCTKKIKEIDAVLAKLDVVRVELQKEHAHCGARN